MPALPTRARGRRGRRLRRSDRALAVSFPAKHRSPTCCPGTRTDSRSMMRPASASGSARRLRTVTMKGTKVLVLLLAALALVAAGCGGDDGNEAADDTDTAVVEDSGTTTESEDSATATEDA